MKNEIRDLKSNLCFKSYSKLGCCPASRGSKLMSNDYTYSWENPNYTQPTSAGSTTTSLSISSCTASQISRLSIHVAAWNCHGIAHAIPYLQILAKQSNNIILTEHWLWPFELSKLDTIVPIYKGTGISDTRLHEQFVLTRGCGGVGIL